ncbi:MAG: type IX secretion system protein PorQ [Bacteroidetes bacterium]|nr:type IX secretion system protein PorQ [Bacteroidota bacterium]
MQVRVVILFLILGVSSIQAQIGGKSTYQFLAMPVSARATAQGGIYNHLYENDASLALGNPAMLQASMHKYMGLSYAPYFAGSHAASFSYVHAFKLANFQFGSQFMNYGKMIEYDELGNDQGLFNVTDMALIVGAGRAYKEKYKFGANAKLAYSQIETYSSLGMAFDLSAMYVDSAKYFSASLVIRNVGFQMKAYTKGKGSQELMPTDIQFGISKRFKFLPFRINVTAHNFTRWDVRYDDPNANTQTSSNIFDQEEAEPKKAAVFFDNFMRHLIIGGEFQFGKAFNLGFAYNHHCRAELGLAGRSGLSGFSAGFGIKIKRIQIQYGVAKFAAKGSSNQISFNINLGEQVKTKKAKTSNNGENTSN